MPPFRKIIYAYYDISVSIFCSAMTLICLFATRVWFAQYALFMSLLPAADALFDAFMLLMRRAVLSSARKSTRSRFTRLRLYGDAVYALAC